MAKNKDGLTGPREPYIPLGEGIIPNRDTNDPGGDGWILIASVAFLGVIVAFLLLKT
jgi:hypothetical protein